MPEGEDDKKEDKFDFDSAGEERGYISLEQARVLEVVIQVLDGYWLHDLHDAAHGVGVLAPLEPVAIRDAVAVRVGLFGVRAVFVDLEEVRESVAVRVGIADAGLQWE